MDRALQSAASRLKNNLPLQLHLADSVKSLKEEQLNSIHFKLQKPVHDRLSIHPFNSGSQGGWSVFQLPLSKRWGRLWTGSQSGLTRRDSPPFKLTFTHFSAFFFNPERFIRWYPHEKWKKKKIRHEKCIWNWLFSNILLEKSTKSAFWVNCQGSISPSAIGGCSVQVRANHRSPFTYIWYHDHFVAIISS